MSETNVIVLQTVFEQWMADKVLPRYTISYGDSTIGSLLKYSFFYIYAAFYTRNCIRFIAFSLHVTKQKLKKN